ncbi:response regulator [Opitutales bacterium]|nr:response regulator [Opitutales bacterium]
MIRLQEYAEGDTVLNDGELGKGFCILESGVLEVVREGKTLSDIDQPGSIFGELSEILGLKRDAVIKAKTAAKVRHVEESIEDIVTKNPKVSVKLIRTLGRRLYRMNILATKEMSANETHSPASTESSVKILVVDDKPNIIKQLTDIFAKNDWIVQSTPDEAGALKICESSSFSAILISMALVDDSAVDLRRKLKTNHNVLNTPVIGMIVQGDESAQKKALNSGFADCITKPFNPNKTDAIMFKVMNLDSSARYFKFIEDFLFFKLPPELSPFVINDIKENMDKRIRNTINEGILKLIIDVSELEEVGEEAIEVVGEFAEKIEDMKLPMRGAIIATGEEADMWNNLDGCEEWGICEDIDSAKEHLEKDPEDEDEE